MPARSPAFLALPFCIFLVAEFSAGSDMFNCAHRIDHVERAASDFLSRIKAGGSRPSDPVARDQILSVRQAFECGASDAGLRHDQCRDAVRKAADQLQALTDSVTQQSSEIQRLEAEMSGVESQRQNKEAELRKVGDKIRDIRGKQREEANAARDRWWTCAINVFVCGGLAIKTKIELDGLDRDKRELEAVSRRLNEEHGRLDRRKGELQRQVQETKRTRDKTEALKKDWENRRGSFETRATGFTKQASTLQKLGVDLDNLQDRPSSYMKLIDEVSPALLAAATQLDKYNAEPRAPACHLPDLPSRGGR